MSNMWGIYVGGGGGYTFKQFPSKDTVEVNKPNIKLPRLNANTMFG